jgi:hypothetical protein
MTPDWAPVVNAAISGLATIVGLVIAGIAAIYVPKAIAAFTARTGVQVTDQQRAAVYAAVKTATGIIQTRLDQGLLKVSDIHEANPDITSEATAALRSVPDAAQAQGTSFNTVVRKIVAGVDTSPKPVIVLPQGAVLAPAV